MTLVPRHATLYPIALAVEYAAEMQVNDEAGWTYEIEIVNAHLGLAQIVVYDEEHVLAGIF